MKRRKSSNSVFVLSLQFVPASCSGGDCIYCLPITSLPQTCTGIRQVVMVAGVQKLGVAHAHPLAFPPGAVKRDYIACFST